MIRSFAKLFVVLVVLSFGTVGAAQAQEPGFEQIKLTETQVKGYLAAQGELDKLLEKVEKAGEQPDPKLVKSLDALASKHGFKSFAELDRVAANISFVFTGFDQDSEGFIEPKKAMQQEVAALKKGHLDSREGAQGADRGTRRRDQGDARGGAQGKHRPRAQVPEATG